MPVPMILAALANAGLGLIKDAVIAKGKEVIEEKIGVKIPNDPTALQDPAVVQRLQQAQFEHEEFLIDAALKEKELDLQAYRAEDEERTKRWVGDMQSDSWLSKNVRPMTLVYWTLVISVMAFVSKWLEVAEVWVEVIKWSYITILGAYFGGRTLEKGTSMVKTMMEKRNVSRR